jgi:hypothetical protein
VSVIGAAVLSIAGATVESTVVLIVVESVVVVFSPPLPQETNAAEIARIANNFFIVTFFMGI